MNTKTFILAGLMLLASSLSAMAENSSIVIVDVQKIIQDSSATKGIRDQIQKVRDGYQAQITKEEKDLQVKDKELSSQRSVLSQEAFAKKQGEFKNQVLTLQRNVQTRRAKLDQAYAKALGEVQKQVEAIIADLAKSKGFTVAVPRTQVLYAGTGLDISDEVLTRLNKNLPRVTVKVEN